VNLPQKLLKMGGNINNLNAIDLAIKQFGSSSFRVELDCENPS
jgi:hypothetical protein